jgi:hypothetical protein
MTTLARYQMGKWEVCEDLRQGMKSPAALLPSNLLTTLCPQALQSVLRNICEMSTTQATQWSSDLEIGVYSLVDLEHAGPRR